MPLRSPCIDLPTHLSRPSPAKDVVARGVREELLVACDGGVDLGPVRGRGGEDSSSSTASRRMRMTGGADKLHVTQLDMSPAALTPLRRTATLAHSSTAVAAGQRLIGLINRGLCEHVEQFIQHFFRTAGCAHSAALAPPLCI